MELGVVFPQTEIGNDPATVRSYAQRAEAAGYTHLHAYDHVLGANPDRPGGWDGPYDHGDAFHEPFALFSHLAAATDDLEFVTGILILPQRQTALVAKQASTVDVLSGGRLKLGVGVGWNPIEYEALGEDFGVRGARIEEQVEVLRALWTDELVEYRGRWHSIPDAGLNPLPVQRPVPIYMGGGADVVLRRVGRLADGWLPPGSFRQPGADFDALENSLAAVRRYAREADRDPDELAVLGRMTVDPDDPASWVERARAWEAVGATHLAIDTMNRGLETPDEHAETVERVAGTLVDADLGG